MRNQYAIRILMIVGFVLLAKKSLCSEKETLSNIVQMVQSSEQLLTDIAVVYEYRVGGTEASLSNSKIDPSHITWKISRRNGQFWEYIQKQHPVQSVDPNQHLTYTDTFSSDGNFFYQVYPRASQYIISDKEEFTQESRVEFYKRGTIFPFGSSYRLSEVLAQESTRILQQSSRSSFITSPRRLKHMQYEQTPETYASNIHA